MNHSDITKHKDEAHQAHLDSIDAAMEKAHKEAVQKWLSENPQVGVLNSGGYYRFENGKLKAVAEFEVLA